MRGLYYKVRCIYCVKSGWHVINMCYNIHMNKAIKRHQHINIMRDYQWLSRGLSRWHQWCQYWLYQRDVHQYRISSRRGIKRRFGRVGRTVMGREFPTWRGTGTASVSKLRTFVDKLWITWGAVDNPASFVFFRSSSLFSEKTGWHLTGWCYTVIVGIVAAPSRNYRHR